MSFSVCECWYCHFPYIGKFCRLFKTLNGYLQEILFCAIHHTIDSPLVAAFVIVFCGSHRHVLITIASFVRMTEWYNLVGIAVVRIVLGNHTAAEYVDV